MGTIVYVKDALEAVVTPDSPLLQDERYAPTLKKYAYTDSEGNLVLSWDIGKFVNHCCQANTLSTGYGFEIAVRDIQAGEEITDDYGLFSFDDEMSLCCDNGPCRRVVRVEDFDDNVARWDSLTFAAIRHLREVDQPLLSLLDDDVLTALQHDLDRDLRHADSLRSVATLRHKSEPITRTHLARRRMRQTASAVASLTPVMLTVTAVPVIG